MSRAFNSRPHVFLLLKRLFLLLLIAAQLVLPLSGRAAPQRQEASTRQQADLLLQKLTPEERVGQIFIFNFQGIDTTQETSIYDLIVNYHIGGVALSAANDNFTAGSDALNQIISMNRQIQLNRWSNSQQQHTNPLSGDTFIPNFIPLFIAVSQQGDGAPYDQILNGVTPLPNQMAIGATWNPELARQAGSILGQELSALGINLLFGPSLDVLETTLPEGGSGLGSRTFGGDPFWVGLMGHAYITGVHQGSNGKVAVAARNFPGIGGADRVPEEEMATVRKSLDQLQNFDLAPFFDVTGNAPSPEAAADALLASHIRYQGFQGNIRATTRPVSFDQQAFNLLMSLPPLTTWRNNGGVMISDDLGSRAVRRFYEITNPEQPFDARRVSLNAFLAGNDLLFLGNITSSDDPDAYTTAIKIIQFFAQKYREDPAFAQRVDQAVLRILQLKSHLYGTFSLNNTIPALDAAATIGISSQIAFDIAREAATLISPSTTEIDNAIPEPPDRTDRIVFITDTRFSKQCSRCEEQTSLNVDSFQLAVLRLYGPQATGQVTPALLKSFSYDDLLALLDNDPDSFQMERELRRADWIIFAMLNVRQATPSSVALDRFLNERLDLFQQKNLIVFAFNAPSYLDATNISKLTAYYGLYSKGPSFIDVAARILFQELRPSGSLPISVPGVGYDLFTATTPDPAQIIPLLLDIPQPEAPTTPTLTLQPEPLPAYRVGDLINIRTGIILDRNGHPVPDGTQVQFITSINAEVSALPQIVSTRNGIARTTIQVSSTGALEIHVEAEPAKISEVLRYDIPAENGGGPTPTPTLLPTETPTATPPPTLTPEPDLSQNSTPAARPHLADWLVAMMLTFIVALISYRLGAYLGHVRWGVRSSFFAFIGGLAAYSILALDFPGVQNLLANYSGWGVVMVTLSGCGIGLLAAWVWREMQAKTHANP